MTARQLAGWEKSGLVAAAESYSFSDLVHLTKLRTLRGHVPSRVIAKTLTACKVAGLANPFVEAEVIVTHPHRLAVKDSGRALDPTNGQLIFDFAGERRNQRVVSIRPERQTVNDLFLQGVKLEENPETALQAIDCYRQLLEIDPTHAAAHINLGTLLYNQQNFSAAERSYRRAIEAEPNYALAHFDLGNVLDETGRLPEAVEEYERALKINPQYADAHYNLALAYERLKMPRRALRHWRAYVKLDTTGPWSNHARMQIERIVNSEQLAIVWRR
ncbi:MAG: tetratricopeptide repeat protein [Acidobacteriales bacterium]|nr:tetratricopeptide repeat protein [Terriglobales bacterium]